jgi:uncharacterized protein YdeI (YjbR/CyaY-like superfamily)
VTPETHLGLPVRAFADAVAFEAGLDIRAAREPAIWLELAKRRAEAIDAVLCFGWIDGQLDKYDDRYCLIRFTPRKPRSKWFS